MYYIRATQEQLPRITITTQLRLVLESLKHSETCILKWSGYVFICYFFAKWRKANAGYWAIMGALLGPIALPFILFAKPKDEHRAE